MPDDSTAQQLDHWYRAAIAAVQPSHTVPGVLDSIALDRARPVRVIGVGKAAQTMSRAALAWCEGHRFVVAPGICVSHTDDSAPVSHLSLHRGDHPLPGDASHAAAASLDTLIQHEVHPGDQILVLLSGGTSALIGAPVATLDASTYRQACAVLLRSGLDIQTHNAIRRRLSCWGNGRLGAALQAAGATVTVLAISDVPGDALASIGSAPCLTTDDDVVMLEAVIAATTLPTAAQQVLRDALRTAARAPSPTCAPIRHDIIGSNHHALDALEAAATSDGLAVHRAPESLSGDADALGARVVHTLLDGRRRGAGAGVWCWGGEPVVSVPAGAPPGGRMQAFALAAAVALHDAGTAARGITILAAGTDGRDGDTDSAGAVIDGDTWARIRAAGRDPAADRAGLESHAALQAVGALLPAFASGTNVNDIVIAHCAH